MKPTASADRRRFPDIVIRLPDWIDSMPELTAKSYPDQEARMRLVIGLARRNMRRGTGGPFGAAVFDMRTHRVIAPGVNMVVPLSCSIVHAEMVAMALAQQIAEHYDLGASEQTATELVCSTEPCAMCLGAIPWSGVRRLVCGARDEDARRVGFDEGPKDPDWPGALKTRGISVVRNVLRTEAAAVLNDYAAAGGVIYNGRQAPSPADTRD